MATSLTYPQRVAIARLHALLELLPTALDQRLSEAQVTTFEHTLLSVLAQSEGGRLRLSELASKTNATLPRLSRVVSSLEKRGLIARTPCAEDGRATNAVLTDLGLTTHARSQELYEAAVSELIFSGLETLPGDGVAQLADLSYAMLSSLDTERAGAALRVVISEVPDADCAADPAAPGTDCAADPGTPCAADPEPSCAADPVHSAVPVVACAADPEPACAADPAAPATHCAADPAPAAADVTAAAAADATVVTAAATA